MDTSKGDSVRTDSRARFVGKEFNTGTDPTLYAATPTLEALKLLLGNASSNEKLNIHVMLSDVKRAYFHAEAQRELYARLPEEDSQYKPGWVGRLRLALYGTRDAAALWQECLAKHLIACGFVRGISTPCVYDHPTRHLRCLVHGDDYATAGALPDVRWLREQLNARFEMKTTIVGHSGEADVVTEGVILNRIVRGHPWRVGIRVRPAAHRGDV